MPLWGGDGDSHSPPLSVEDRVRRVTPHDLNAVTPDDVSRVARGMTHSELLAAARVMLEGNKFADAVAYSRAETWHAAAMRVGADSLMVMPALLRERWSTLYSVIPYVTADFLAIMDRYYEGP